ncbi:hypothetical protein ABZX69_33030 [Streptomyces sp. NPDC004074]|uniref:hypothetical protein n=1 Tax=Streptomyces sp. NPDC004074 TaxID=3154277 RepID=UPI0033B3CF20
MDDATPPTAAPPGAEAELEPVDEALGASLLEQGEAGARALGLLRDAHRMLGDERYEQQAEIAESCVRGAVDALLKLPGSRKDGREPVGLKSAAHALLDAVDAYQPPDEEPAVGEGRRKKRGSRDPQAALRRIREAAQGLRPELERPGGYHRRRAMGVAERLMGQRLGAAQESALHAWGELYSGTSDVLHGGPSSQARARYRQVLRLAREVFVPLPGRAAEVLELTGHRSPTAEDVERLAAWADPRAMRYFFLSRPAAAWLDLLDEVWLLPDTTSPEGNWPAAPYLDHLTEAAPERARTWLAEHAAQVAAGPEATGALLRLAARPGIGLHPKVRTVVSALTREGREPQVADGWLLRLAADWAGDIPLAERDEDWIRTVEMLLAAFVRTEHDQEIRTATEDGDLPGDETRERTPRLPAGRLPTYEAAQLLLALRRTAYPSSRRLEEGPAHPCLPLIRTVLAVLLQASVQRIHPAIRHSAVFHRDLDEVALDHPEAFFAPLLARAVLDVAAADARAGVPLGERTATLVRQLGKADPQLRDRLLASHLQQLPPDATPGSQDADTWWEKATGLLPALLAHRPTPEGARLVDYLLSNCPPEAATHLHAQLADACGPVPGPKELADYDPSSSGLPPRAWVRVWDWSPVLPAPVLTSWEPVLSLLRRAKPSGPADPRTAEPLVQITNSPPPAVDETQAVAIAAEHGPAAAADALAAAPDAGDWRYLKVLRALIETDPAAWTTAPAEITARLAQPRLRAFYLSLAAEQIRRPDAFPGNALAEATTAALAAHRDTGPGTNEPPATDPDDDQPSAAYLTEQAMLDLVFTALRTDTDLGDGLPAVLDRLYHLTAPLTTPPASTPDDTPPGTLPADFVGTDPAGRALHCLLEHAQHQHGAPGNGLPTRALNQLTTITEATGTQPRTAAALGPYLPLLHQRARDWLLDHRSVLLHLPADGTPSAASAWLRWGPAHPPLLAHLDRAELLTRLRTSTPPEAASHVALALLDDPHFLGDPTALLTELASEDGGTAAASRLLELLAHYTAHAAAAPVTASAVELWQAALAADLPEGAVAGAGTFALTSIDDTLWLGLTLASARQTPALRDTDHIAERSADHPDKPAAAQLTALLVAHPSTDPWRDATVRQYARTLLAAIGQRPPNPQLAQPTQQLRDALITAGDIDAHEL